MLAILFFVMGVVFAWLLFKGYTTKEIMARGWGTQIRIYTMDTEPIMYWITFGSYVFIVITCFVVSILIATHGG